MKKCVVWVMSALGLGSTVTAGAHDFWVQPDIYRTEPGVTVPITLQVGHGPFRQRSPLRLPRITRFATVGQDGPSADLRGNLHLGGATDDGELLFDEPGIYVVVLETDNRAQSRLPAIRFNDYLRTEGLTAVLAQRERTDRTDTDGSESYSRHSKALVQVGSQAIRPQAVGSSVGANPAQVAETHVTQPVGMALEIVPDVDPFALPKPVALPVHVLFDGKPLRGALVKLTSLDHDAEPVETHTTDEDGRSSFAMPDRGRWLLNVIWSKPLPTTRETDFETFFSSLSFGW